MPVTCGVHTNKTPSALPDFDFVATESLEEALALLATESDVAIVAGGTDLLRNIHLGHIRPKLVLSILGLSELRGISRLDDGSLRIGALTSMRELAESDLIHQSCPALAQAAAQVGSVQVRNRATMGGNLVNASPCADTAGPAYVYNTQVHLQRKDHQRRLPLTEFIVGPGETRKRPDELLTGFEIPPPKKRTSSAFYALTRRKSLEITIVSATARISLDPSGAISEAKLCLGSVAPTPLLSTQAEKALVGHKPTPATLNQAAQLAAQDASPIDDLRAQAQYRRMMVEVLSRRALATALERAQH